METEKRRLLSSLRTAVRGSVLGPEDSGYDDARAVFSPSVDRRPAAVVRPADAADVAEVVTFARDRRVELAVKGGGHSAAGHGASDGGIVLDLGSLHTLEIDDAGRVCVADGGLTAGEVTVAAGAQGFAVPFGDAASVGIGGLTLGGGIGYLVRRHGLTVDSLLAADVVTADGEVLHVDRAHHPDLFWAIRGGGGNFGVVTRFHYRLHPLDVVTGGMLMLPATAATVAAFAAACDAAPEALSAVANIVAAPPLPSIPAEHHGRFVIVGMVVYAGTGKEAEEALGALRSIAPPIVDLVRPLRYPEMFAAEESGPRPSATMRTQFVDRIGVDEAAELLERMRGSTAERPAAQLRVLGGAASRVDADATAFAHRASRTMLNVAAVYSSSGDADVHERWVRETAAALRSGHERAYVNFLGDEGEDRVRAAYPGRTWTRLAEVKRRYDPQNVFRLNQNVPPGDGALDEAA
jgi:FAD/FMN-containing dehydrogenase